MGWTEQCRGCHYENACDYIHCRKEDNADYDALRNKTIDEFAGLLIDILTGWAEINRMGFSIHGDRHGYLTVAKAYDRVIDLINEMAEDMKGVRNDN